MDMKELEMFCSISISYGIFKKNIPLGKKEGFFFVNCQQNSCYLKILLPKYNLVRMSWNQHCSDYVYEILGFLKHNQPAI